MLVIRLSRMGKKKRPSYRVVVQEKQRDPWGTSIEILGHYDPMKTTDRLVLKEDRTKHWLEKGAQPSPTMHNLLVDAKLVKGPKVRATTKDKKAPEAAAEAPAEAPAATEGKSAEPAEEKKAE